MKMKVTHLLSCQLEMDFLWAVQMVPVAEQIWAEYNSTKSLWKVTEDIFEK